MQWYLNQWFHCFIGQSSLPPEASLESRSPVNGYSPQQDTIEEEAFSSVSPQTEHHTAGVDRPTNQCTVTCSPESVVRDLEVIYDDVPTENLQHPVDGKSNTNLHYRKVHTGAFCLKKKSLT